MTRKLSTVSLLLVATFLTSCHFIFDDTGYLRDHKDDYLKETSNEHINIPEQLLQDGAREAYPVQDVEKRAQVVSGNSPWEPPKPPLVVEINEEEEPEVDPEDLAVETDQVKLTVDGNGYTVIMLDMEFNWAWALVGDAIGKASIELDDLDRDRAIYYIQTNIDPEGVTRKKVQGYQIKLNYTSNGVQVALQKNENALAPKPLAEVLLTQLHEYM